MINFTNPNAIKKLFASLSEKKCSSIIKSHFPVEFFSKEGEFFFPKNLKIIYVYRNPVDTMISYKNFTDHFNKNNHEGPSCDSFINFTTSSPEGRMMRYQLYQNKSIIDRWANHVSGWLEAADSQTNILPINYDDLNEDYDVSVNRISDFLDIHPNEKATRPNKTENTVHIPIDAKPSEEERIQLVALIKGHLTNERLRDLVR